MLPRENYFYLEHKCVFYSLYFFLFFRTSTGPEACLEGMPSVNNDINKNDFFTRCGITWNYLTSTRSMSEFDDLRRRHQVFLKNIVFENILKIQVSKNRHVGYGIRYACTRNAKARDNCPYLLLHIPGKFLNNPQLK